MSAVSKVDELIALDKAMYEAVERFHIKHVPHDFLIVLGVSSADLALLSTWGNDLPTPTAFHKGVFWWGSTQVVEDALVPSGSCRVLVSAESIKK